MTVVHERVDSDDIEHGLFLRPFSMCFSVTFWVKGVMTPGLTGRLPDSICPSLLFIRVNSKCFFIWHEDVHSRTYHPADTHGGRYL